MILTITNANPSAGSRQAVFCGAVATANLGTTLADWQRKREEEEAKKRAEAAAREGAGGKDGKKTPGQRAYEKIMKQKHIVGESQALLDEKRSVYTPSQKLEEEETNWLKKLSPVYQYEKRKEEAKQKAELQAGLSAYYEGRKKGEEKTASTPPQSGLLSNLWNAGISALWSVLSPEKNKSGGGLLSVRDDDPPPNPIAQWWNEVKTWVKNWWQGTTQPQKQTPIPTTVPTSMEIPLVTFTPTISVLPTATMTPGQPKIYQIDGPMTAGQIPPEFKCSLEPTKVINGKELYSDYYDRCKIGEQLMEGILTDPNGWWWKNGETKHWQTGNLTHWEGIKSNEDVWKLAMAIGLDGEGTDLRLNDPVFGDYLKTALYNRFWHFDKTQIATYENVPDPSAQPLGTNGRLTVLGALESIQIRVTEDGNGFVSRGLPASEVILPPYDDYITNDWESAWNGNTDLFKDEPQIGFIKPADPFDFGNPTPDMNPEIKKALNQGYIGEGYNQILYSYEGEAYVLTFEQKMY